MAMARGYNGLQIGLHWAIAVLIAVNYLIAEDMGRSFDAHLEGAAVGFFPAMAHVYLGLAVLALAVVRLLVRVIKGAPGAPPSGSGLLDQAGLWAHRLLYLLMIAVPTAGATAWYLGIEKAGDLHVLLMNGLLIVVGLHTAAALFHQYVLKDRLLLRMLRPQ